MMEFNDNKPIYRQIADYAYNAILSGQWEPEAIIPSVRELSAQLGVNSRTVLKAMEQLQNSGIITMRRGLGSRVSSFHPTPRRGSPRSAAKNFSPRHFRQSLTK